MVRSESGLTHVDRELERRVVNYLAQQHFPRLQRMEVKARQGVVSIRGRVNSYYERQLCINCCQRVAGVIQLDDGIEVRRRAPEPVVESPRFRPMVALAG
jgi:osmotically-inducible protein OsmY